MRKCRLYSLLRKTLSALLCLSMMLSIVTVTDFSGLFHFTEKVKAADAPDPKEYENETLEHMWDSDGDDKPDDDFLKAARPYYACRNSSFGGVQYRTIFHVYAFEGDTICIGSSVFDSTLDINHVANRYTSEEKGSIDIVMTDLNGVAHAIDIRNSDEDGVKNTTGYIPDWQTEWAAIKYLEKKDGKFSGTYNDGTNDYTYIPYTYTVKETGVYTFEFHSYNKSDTLDNLDGFRMRNEVFQQYKSNYGGEIAAINLTVFNESGEEQHGRTYADFLSLQMHPDGKGVVDSYYILTTDSYIYKMTFNDAKPYTYNFFSNNKGLYDPATGEIIYTSVKDINNDNTYDEMGAAYKYPGTKDTDMLKSFYIFLEYPDDQLEGEMYEKPVPPDPASNLQFDSVIKDADGNSIPGAYEGEGGYFSFDVEEATTATLRLEFKSKSGEVYAPVEISGAVTPHTTNSFYWNGKDGNGKVIPQGDYSVDDLTFTITTKAGEIHFPIIDMEFSTNGITFTRLNHIYNKDGVRLDYDDNIYGKTKHLIYYDDTALYYGEPAASTGFSEADVVVAKNKFTTSDGFSGNYFPYNNMNVTSGGENVVRTQKSNYVKTNKIRVGDHSHTTNVVKYFNEDGSLTSGNEQNDMIEYLDSEKYPVGKASGSGGNSTTTDYAIANFWTFIPSQPAKANLNLTGITIAVPPTNHFSLTGRVFFDADGKGTFDDMSENGDYALSGVTLNLYKKTTDESYIEGKIYVSYNPDGTVTALLNSSDFVNATRDNIYELVGKGKTTGDGMYKFTGLEYDPNNGTEYLYQVENPSINYTLTTQNQKATPLSRANGSYKQMYGYYADKSYNNSYKGTEVQHIKVGGTDGVDPNKYGYDTTKDKPEGNTTVCAVDVGYNYTVLKQSLVLKKIWDTTEMHPAAVAYEVHGKTNAEDVLYNYRVMSAITSWQHDDEYLPEMLNGSNVVNYYVAAEYYIEGDYIYKHRFAYNTSSGRYESFVGTSQSAPLSKLNEIVGKDVKNFSNIPDLSVLTTLNWTTVTETKQPYKAVLDRNIGSDSSTITITNAKSHGTIEIFKYQGTKSESNALQGATFRIYELKEGKTVDDLKNLIADSEKGNTAATNELKSYQVGSATTRSNGRVAFPGLDPAKTYFIREVFAPSGFRIMNPFYVVNPYKPSETTNENEGIYQFDLNNYVKVDVGNAPADKNFYILKEIDGRAWQTNDSFSFTVLNGYENNGTPLSDASGIKVDADEQYLMNSTSSSEDVAINQAIKFADEFKKTSSSSKNIITINNGNEQYHFPAKDDMNQYYEYTYPNRKMSKQLLVDGSEYNAVTKEKAASFCDVEFPMAGVYTFTIAENEPTVAGDKTLAKSEYEFTVIINVTRVPNTGVTVTESGLTLEISHLVAEVTSITYIEKAGDTTKIFAGSSPLFTNTYAPAPAKQDTNYNIVKNFTGRTGDAWRTTDKFTVRVSGVDSETQDAIKNKNIVIDGFENAVLNNSVNAFEWVHEFNEANHIKWDFTSFTFDEIMFPVQYVKQKSDGTIEVWDPDEHNGELSPPKDLIKDYSPQTLPVTYWLKIAEDIPNELKGIEYDNNVYYLQIILRNAKEKVSTGSSATGEEEDGIIDEIDMNLYHVYNTVNDVTKLQDTDIVATCHTKAEVLEFEQWKNDVTVTDSTKESYAWFYVANNGQLQKAETHDIIPDNAKLLVRRYEKHGGEEDGHTMTFKNIYHTSYSWAPRIIKVLSGTNREWLDTDKFTFTITADSTNSEQGCDLGPGKFYKITIEKSDTDTAGNHTKQFPAIRFSQPGDYNFIITETDSKNTLATYEVKVNVTDNGDGTLKPMITGSDSAAIKDDHFEFVNTYESTSFDLGISKTIIGREWKADDSFTFKITPDNETLEAIKNGIITMPDALRAAATDGSYTVTIDKNEYNNDQKLAIKELGEITINNTGSITAETHYKFTISEVTTDLKEMYCREPDIDVNITVTPSILPGTKYENKFNLIVTYVHKVSGSTSDPMPTDQVTIPFENVSMGTLTVKKMVVSNAKEDIEDFKFKVVFTYFDKKDHVIVNDSSLTPEKSSDDTTWTYTFNLKDGKSVVFSNIPPNTNYTITETDDPDDKYVLLRVRDHETDDGEIVPLDGNSLSGEIKGDNALQFRLFINGLIKELPSSGDKGIDRYIFCGTVLTVGAIVLLAMLYFKRRNRRETAE